MQIAFQPRFSRVSAAFQPRFSSLEIFSLWRFFLWSQNIRVSQSQTFGQKFDFCVSAAFQLAKTGCSPSVRRALTSNGRREAVCHHNIPRRIYYGAHELVPHKSLFMLIIVWYSYNDGKQSRFVFICLHTNICVSAKVWWRKSSTGRVPSHCERLCRAVARIWGLVRRERAL